MTHSQPEHDREDEIDAPVSLDDFLTEMVSEDDDFAQAWAEAAPLRMLAELVGDLRNMRGLTQKELAERIGKQQPAIARIENGSINSGWETVAGILQALRIDMHFSPAEAKVMMISHEEFDARIRSAEQKGFADGMAQAVNMQAVRHAKFGMPAGSGEAVNDTTDLTPA